MLAEIFGMDGIVVIAVLAAVLFGSSQIPKLARSLGSARREFTEGLQDKGEDTTTTSADEAHAPTA
jgi:TatA/E family protein of Tat protein translocase